MDEHNTDSDSHSVTSNQSTSSGTSSKPVSIHNQKHRIYSSLLVMHEKDLTSNYRLSSTQNV